MGGKSTPKPADYGALANQQAESSKDVTEQQTWANRADQYTPFGNQTWQNQQVWDDSTQQYLNRWAQTTQLPEELERAAQAQKETTEARSNLARDMTGRMRSEYGTAMDWSGIRAGGGDVAAGNLDSSEKYRKSAEDAIYNKWSDRAKPEMQQAQTDKRTQLYNMGLKEGDAAYDREMKKLGQQQGDAQQQAAYQATIGGGSEAQRMLGMDATAGAQNFGQQMQSSQYSNQLRQQQMAEEMQKRGFSLNEMNALLSGQQVSMPNMPGYNTAAASQGVQSLQAGQLQQQANMDQFNAQQAQQQGMMSGIGGMAGSFMGMSDRRLKRDIELVGQHEGVNIYTWTYVWGQRGKGVMADEVPWAVVNINGYDAVDYSRVW